MLLHGIPDAQIENGDTLAEPLHLEGGELMRFDRVITNPPFSQNYTQDGIHNPERFRYGWCAEKGKKADLMFVQHMISVLRTKGMIATVMPHGVLFRGGPEREIRKGFLDDDLLDAVIGLAPNLFYGTGIPACILVLRARGSKPPERRGKVLFINADADFSAGRAQNYLMPEHAGKIVSAYHAFADIPGYAAVMAHDDLKANDFNLNIRRYADNAPPPEPQDVRAHLLGGIPKQEVSDQAAMLVAHGFDLRHVFVDRDADYYDFADSIKSKTDIQSLIKTDPGVQGREGELNDIFEVWWEVHAKSIVELPGTKALMAARASLLDSFIEALAPVGLLDRFQVAGVIARWWDDIQFDLRALVAGGFGAVIDGWATTITTGLEEDNAKADPLEHQFVRLVLPEYLAELGAAKARCAHLEVTVKTRIATLDGDEDECGEDDDVMSPSEFSALKEDLGAAKKRAKALTGEFVDKLVTARADLSTDQEQGLVLAVAHTGLGGHLDAYVASHRRLVAAALENWWDKYAVTLRAIEEERATASNSLDAVLKSLKYE
jgi:type I restriction enzyme M protein